MTGKVFLVGAGPGDPGLMTVRGAEILRTADVVVVDALVAPSLFRSLSARIIYVGKRGPGAPSGSSLKLSQPLINRLLVRLARRYASVVRLKGGDPFVFGRGSEELEALEKARVPFEVVPGVSSVNAVPAYAGIPITDRRWASQITVITGHEGADPKATGPGVDWKRISPKGTLVVLMGVSEWPRILRTLLANGWSRHKPVAAIESGTTRVQRVIRTVLEDSQRDFLAAKLVSPATIVVGDVVQANDRLAWLNRERPLLGKRVVVTRPVEQNFEFVSMLERQGAEAIVAPSIQIRPLVGRPPRLLSSYDWIIFLSVNAVRTFSAVIEKRRRLYDRCAVLCVGPQTAQVAEQLGWRVTKIPNRFDSSGVVAALGNISKKSILLPRVQHAPKDLPRALTARGARVHEVVTYETLPAKLNSKVRRQILAGVDAVTFTSTSTARNFLAQLRRSEIDKIFRSAAAVSMGRQTTAALQAAGVSNIREARNATLQHLIEAIPK